MVYRSLENSSSIKIYSQSKFVDPKASITKLAKVLEDLWHTSKVGTICKIDEVSKREF